MFHGHIAIAKLIIDQHANIYCRDAIDLAPCHYAIDGGHLAAIKFILDLHFVTVREGEPSNAVSLGSILWRAGNYNL